jgi:hypothetical protein
VRASAQAEVVKTINPAAKQIVINFFIVFSSSFLKETEIIELSYA